MFSVSFALAEINSSADVVVQDLNYFSELDVPNINWTTCKISPIPDQSEMWKSIANETPTKMDTTETDLVFKHLQRKYPNREIINFCD